MTPCPACGAQTPTDAARCEACGAALDAGARRTVFGVPSPSGAADRGATAGESHRTVFGMARPAGLGAPQPPSKDEAARPPKVAPAPKTAPARPPKTAPAPPPKTAPVSADPHRTLFGMARPDTHAPAANAPPAEAPTDAHRTLFGMAAPGRASAPPPAAPPPPAAAPQQTLFGVPAPRDDAPTPGPRPLRPAAAEAPPALGEQTLFGVPSAARPAPPPGAHPVLTGADPQRTLDGPPNPDVAAHPPKAPRSAEDRERAELYNAARIAAAVAADERRAARGRTLRLLTFLAVAAVAAAIAASFALREKAAFRAHVREGMTVVRGDAVYRVRLTLDTSAPAVVRHPGGEVSVEGSADLRFDVPADSMQVGDNALELHVIPDEGRPVVLRPKVTVFYRLSAPALGPPRLGTPVEATVRLMPRWTVAVEGGTVRAGDAPDTFVLAMDPAPLLARVDGLEGPTGELPVAMSLTGPDGTTRQFTERLRLPLPDTPASVYEPPFGWASEADRVTLRGRTLPDAAVQVGSIGTRADAQGDFELVVPLGEPGPQTLDVEVDAASRRPSIVSVKVRRLDADAAEAQRAALEKRVAELKAPRRTTRYTRLVKDLEGHTGAAVRLKGKVVTARRGEVAGTDVLQMTTCRRGDGCPIWVETKAPVLVGPGERATVIGAVAGAHAYRTAGGEAKSVPRLVDAVLLP